MWTELLNTFVPMFGQLWGYHETSAKGSVDIHENVSTRSLELGAEFSSNTFALIYIPDFGLPSLKLAGWIRSFRIEHPPKKILWTPLPQHTPHFFCSECLIKCAYLYSFGKVFGHAIGLHISPTHTSSLDGNSSVVGTIEGTINQP